MKIQIKAKRKGRGNFKTILLAQLLLPDPGYIDAEIAELILQYQNWGFRVWYTKME